MVRNEQLILQLGYIIHLLGEGLDTRLDGHWQVLCFWGFDDISEINN